MLEASGLHSDPGHANLLEDPRITWASEIIGPLSGKRILELGPLEGAHTYMLDKLGASVVAVEANANAYLKCLCMKEVLGMRNAKFLLGDFMKLKWDDLHFDAIFASGVLYHMTEPLTLIHKMAAATRRIFIWTHYYDAEIVASRQDRELFSAPFEVAPGLTASRRLYPEAALSWRGFSGGPEAYAVWLEKGSIMRALSALGYSVVTNFDHIDHPNGPAVALCAVRPGSILRRMAYRLNIPYK